MFFSSRKKKTSLLRRLTYLLIIVSGGSAGGYAFQDHPVVQSLIAMVAGKPLDEIERSADGSLVANVVGVLKPGESFTKPGIYQVAIEKVALDQKLFKPGHTVDIQARVRKISASGRETTIWEAREFGSRLAVVGKDDLNAGWPDRPFQVSWSPGDQFILEVYDARIGLFTQPRRFAVAAGSPSASEFPLKSGDLPLQTVGDSETLANPRTNHVVLESQRLGDFGSAGANASATEVAERPIVIR